MRRPATGSLEEGRDGPQRPGVRQAIERMQDLEVNGLSVDELAEVIVLQRIAARSAERGRGQTHRWSRQISMSSLVRSREVDLLVGSG